MNKLTAKTFDHPSFFLTLTIIFFGSMHMKLLFNCIAKKKKIYGL